MSKPPAHRPPSPEQIEHTRLVREELDLFFAHLDLVLAHEQDILACDEYYFCQPIFAQGGGAMWSTPIKLGTLLLGWRTGILIDTCQLTVGPRKGRYTCGGQAYVYKYGGLLSDTGWGGYCTACKNRKFTWDSTFTSRRCDFNSCANEQFVDWAEVLELEHYPSHKFNFGEPARLPSTEARMRRTKVPLTAPMTVATMIEELHAGQIRLPTPQDRTLLKEVLIVKRDGVETDRIKLLRSTASS